MADDIVSEERTDGPTPNGGAYAVVYFRDGMGRPTSKAKAAAVEITEYDDTGRVVGRTYGTLTPPTDPATQRRVADYLGIRFPES